MCGRNSELLVKKYIDMLKLYIFRESMKRSMSSIPVIRESIVLPLMSDGLCTFSIMPTMSNAPMGANATLQKIPPERDMNLSLRLSSVSRKSSHRSRFFSLIYFSTDAITDVK